MTGPAKLNFFHRVLMSAALLVMASVPTLAISLEDHKARNATALSLAQLAEYYV